MATLPPPVTSTDAYLARIVQQNDDIISHLKQMAEPAPILQPTQKVRPLQEPGTCGQNCPDVPLQEPKRRKR